MKLFDYENPPPKKDVFHLSSVFNSTTSIILFSQFLVPFFIYIYLSCHTSKHTSGAPQQAPYQPLLSPAWSIMQTPRQLNSQGRDTNFFSARDISRTLNKANSCIEFWWCKAKPSIWAFSQKKAELSLKYSPGRKESVLCYHESLFT